MLVMQMNAESPPPEIHVFPRPHSREANFLSLVPRPLTPCFLLLDPESDFFSIRILLTA